MSFGQRVLVCALDDILDGGGACALVDGEQVAVFRVGDEVLALDNHDPCSGANVLSRGIVGDLQGELVVASPVYKQHYALRTGRCLEDDSIVLRRWPCGVIDGRVWVEPIPGARPEWMPRPARRQLVVVGNGMAAMRTVEELLALAPDAYDVTVFGAEPRGNYNRVLLSPLLAGELSQTDVETHSRAWYAEHGITLHAGDPVVSIDRRRRTVTSAAGRVACYDRLLLATGSSPNALVVPGADLAGVATFRNLDDVDVLRSAARSARRAVVVGGGLLGLEAACGLAALGLAVTVVHRPGRLLDRQMDEEGAAMLQEALERRGIAFRLRGITVAFEGDSAVEAVRLARGERIPADLVVVATGTRPRVDLARSAGLRCDRGILVDDTLQTFDPAIYAVGECVQHRGATYGLVAPLWEQARACAAHLAEHGGVRYTGSRPTTQLKVSGINLFSAGDVDTALSSAESLRFSDRSRGIYRRLFLKQGQLTAAVLYGDLGNAAWYADLVKEGTDVTSFRDQLLLGDPASAGCA